MIAKGIFLSVIMAVSFALTGAAGAQSFPSKLITIVVP
jgi:hypothetical protein